MLTEELKKLIDFLKTTSLTNEEIEEVISMVADEEALQVLENLQKTKGKITRETALLATIMQ